MPMLVSPDLPRPEDFHEIARFRLIEVIEVLSKLQLVKQAGGAGSVCVPAAPHAFPVVLITDNQLIQRRKIQLQLSAIAQLLDDLLRALDRRNRELSRHKRDIASLKRRIAALEDIVYELDDDGFISVEEIDVPPELEAQARRGARACPERIITVEE